MKMADKGQKLFMQTEVDFKRPLKQIQTTNKKSCTDSLQFKNKTYSHRNDNIYTETTTGVLMNSHSKKKNLYQGLKVMVL